MSASWGTPEERGSNSSQSELQRVAVEPDHYALVSPEDHALVSQYRWRLLKPEGGYRYARANVGGQTVLMHRLVLRDQLADGAVVDHVNGDGLDNRRDNLRACTPAQNGYNRRPAHNKKYRGVSRFNGQNKWVARIGKGGRTFYLGSFDTPRKAAAAWNRVARRLFGVFARLNELGRA